eukprot:scaffold6424_cov17-Tisochrysis_lutea.AAC.1
MVPRLASKIFQTWKTSNASNWKCTQYADKIADVAKLATTYANIFFNILCVPQVIMFKNLAIPSPFWEVCKGRKPAVNICTIRPNDGSKSMAFISAPDLSQAENESRGLHINCPSWATAPPIFGQILIHALNIRLHSMLS